MRYGEAESIGYEVSMDAPDKQQTRNAEQTKARILAAAQDAFAEMGYGQAGIRHIAMQAGIDAALVQRYFKSKARLYEAALLDAMSDFPAMDLSHSRFGERLTGKLIETFFDLRPLSMIVLSFADPEAQEISLRVMREKAIRPLVDWLGPPDAETRAVRMMMLTTSFMIYTRQLPLMTPDEATGTQTSDWLALQLQQIIDESEGNVR